jgi:hypothetical protein
MAKELPEHEEGCKVVIACEIMKPELEALSKDENHVEVVYLEQGLHRTPQKMPAVVQEEVDRVAPYAASVVLGYGLCSNGIVGVTARQQGLIVPRCHDCIALFMGSLDVYNKVFSERPGTYYLTAGWIAEKKDPLGIVEDDYTPRLGRETAVWVMEEELKHYTHIVLVSNGIGEVGPLRERAMENARFFQKDYEEMEVSLDYFTKLIRGPYGEEDFFFFEPGEKVKQEVYFEEAMR